MTLLGLSGYTPKDNLYSALKTLIDRYERIAECEFKYNQNTEALIHLEWAKDLQNILNEQ